METVENDEVALKEQWRRRNGRVLEHHGDWRRRRKKRRRRRRDRLYEVSQDVMKSEHKTMKNSTKNPEFPNYSASGLSSSVFQKSSFVSSD